MMKRYMILTTALIIICMVLTGCNRTTDVDNEQKVTATVTAKDHSKEHVNRVYQVVDGKTFTIIETVPAKYRVTVNYKGIEHTFDNKDMYENVDVGDSITVILVNGYNKDHELITQYIKC